VSKPKIKTLADHRAEWIERNPDSDVPPFLREGGRFDEVCALAARREPGPGQIDLLDLVEDAFLEAMEAGANPPASFTVRLPAEAFKNRSDLGSYLEVAGYTIKLERDQ
jgi:hypothetical protein